MRLAVFLPCYHQAIEDGSAQEVRGWEKMALREGALAGKAQREEKAMVSMVVVLGSPIFFLRNAALSWNPNISSGCDTHHHQPERGQ